MLIKNFETCKTKNESTRIPSARVSQDPKPNILQAHPGGKLIVPRLGVKTTDVAFSLNSPLGCLGRIADMFTPQGID